MMPWSLTVAAAALVLVAGCDRPPSSSDLREWSPRDHDRAEEANRIRSGQQPGAGPQLSALEALAEATWRSKCGDCHGPMGAGDGPKGAQVKASDLTRPDWQASVTDQDIAGVIRRGKNQMPAFPDLQDDALNGLVARIRKFRGGQQQQ